MLSRLSLLLLSMLYLLAPGTISADTETSTAKHQMRAGITAFQNNDLEQARQLLEAAATQLDSRALTYNLGVLYYKLGEYDLAENKFRQLLDTKQRGLAFYNIGLIALAQDNPRKARSAFRNAAIEGAEDKLGKLARAQLKDLGEIPPPSQWQGLISLAGGYEENIGLFPDTAPSSVDDTFLESVGVVSGYPVRRGNDAMKAQLQLYGRQYADEQDFNTHLARLDTAWERSSAPYRFSLGIGGDQLWRGGSSQEQRARLSGQIATSACQLGSEAARCTVSVDAEQVYSDTRLDAYDGQHYRLDLRYKSKQDAWRGDVRYRLDYDDRENFDTGSEFYSVSPMGQTLSFGIGYAFTPAIELGTSAGYRLNYYRTAHRLQTAEGLQEINRKDHRYTVGIDGEYRVNRALSLLLDVQLVKNDSNIARYDYDKRTASVGVAVRL